MKFFLSIIIVFYCSLCHAQQTDYNKSVTDSIVTAIDASKGEKEKFSWMLGYIEFNIINGRISKMSHTYKAGPKDKTEIFYISNSGLVYSAEKEHSYYLHGDTSVWAGSYYFEKKKLVDYVTLGHGKSETGNWNPEKDVLMQYEKVLARVKEYQKKKKVEKTKFRRILPKYDKEQKRKV